MADDVGCCGSGEDTPMTFKEGEVVKRLEPWVAEEPLQLTTAQLKYDEAQAKLAGNKTPAAEDQVLYWGERDDQDRPHGFGRCLFLGTLDAYSGEWRHGQFCGLGLYRYNNHNRSTYAGYFGKGKPHGLGCFMNMGRNESSIHSSSLEQATSDLQSTGGHLKLERLDFETKRVLAGRFHKGAFAVHEQEPSAYSTALKVQRDAIQLETWINQALGGTDEEEEQDNAKTRANPRPKHDPTMPDYFDGTSHMDMAHLTPGETSQLLRLLHRCAVCCNLGFYGPEKREEITRGKTYRQWFNRGFELVQSLPAVLSSNGTGLELDTSAYVGGGAHSSSSRGGSGGRKGRTRHALDSTSSYSGQHDSTSASSATHTGTTGSGTGTGTSTASTATGASSSLSSSSAAPTLGARVSSVSMHVEDAQGLPVMLCMRDAYRYKVTPAGAELRDPYIGAERFIITFLSPPLGQDVSEHALRQRASLVSVDFVLKLLGAQVQVVVTGHSYGGLMARIFTERVLDALEPSPEYVASVTAKTSLGLFGGMFAGKRQQGDEHDDDAQGVPTSTTAGLSSSSSPTAPLTGAARRRDSNRTSNRSSQRYSAVAGQRDGATTAAGTDGSTTGTGSAATGNTSGGAGTTTGSTATTTSSANGGGDDEHGSEEARAGELPEHLKLAQGLYCVTFGAPPLPTRRKTLRTDWMLWARAHVHQVYSTQDRVPYIACAVARRESSQRKLHRVLCQHRAVAAQWDVQEYLDELDVRRYREPVHVHQQTLREVTNTVKAGLMGVSVWILDEEDSSGDGVLQLGTPAKLESIWARTGSSVSTKITRIFSRKKDIDMYLKICSSLQYHSIATYAEHIGNEVQLRQAMTPTPPTAGKTRLLAGNGPAAAAATATATATGKKQEDGGGDGSENTPGAATTATEATTATTSALAPPPRSASVTSGAGTDAADESWRPRPGLDVEITKKVVHLKDRTLHLCLYGWNLSHIRRIDVLTPQHGTRRDHHGRHSEHAAQHQQQGDATGSSGVGSGSGNGGGGEHDGVSMQDRHNHHRKKGSDGGGGGGGGYDHGDSGSGAQHVICFREFGADDDGNARESMVGGGDGQVAQQSAQHSHQSPQQNRSSRSAGTLPGAKVLTKQSSTAGTQHQKQQQEGQADKDSEGDIVLVDVYRDESQLDIDMELNYSSQASSILGIQAFGASVACKLTDKVVDLRITSVFSVQVIPITADELTSNSEKVKLSEFFYLKPSDELARMLFLRMVLLRQAHLRHKRLVAETEAKEKEKERDAQATANTNATAATQGSGDGNGSGGGGGEEKKQTTNKSKKSKDTGGGGDGGMLARVGASEWNDFWTRVEEVIEHDAMFIDEARSYNSLLSILYRWEHWDTTKALVDDETELSGQGVSSGHETHHVLRRRWELQNRAREYWRIVASTYRVSVQHQNATPDSITLREQYKDVNRVKLKNLYLSAKQCELLHSLLATAWPDHVDNILLPAPRGSEDEMQPPMEYLFGELGSYAFDAGADKRASLMSAIEKMKEVDDRTLKTNEPHMMNLLYEMEDLVDLFSTFFDGRIILHETRRGGSRNTDTMLTALAEWPTNAFLSVVRVMAGLMPSEAEEEMPAYHVGARHGTQMALPSSKTGFAKKCAARLHFRKRRRRFAAISDIGERELGPLTTKLTLLSRFLPDTEDNRVRKPEDVAEELLEAMTISDVDKPKQRAHGVDEKYIDYEGLLFALDPQNDLGNFKSEGCRRVCESFRKKLPEAGILPAQRSNSKCKAYMDNSFSYNTICQWIRGVTGIRRPLSLSLTKLPIIAVVGPQQAGKSTILKQLGFEAQIYHYSGSTKVFDAFPLGTCGAFIVDCFGRNEALERDHHQLNERARQGQFDKFINTTQAQDSHYVFRRAVDMYLPSLLRLAQYIVVALPATDGFRDWNTGFEQMALLLQHSSAPVCFLNTKFDLALDEGFAQFSNRDQCYEKCASILSARYRNFAKRLPGRDMMARLFFRKQESNLDVMREAEDHPALRHILWSQDDLRIHLRSICVTHLNLDPELVDLGLGMDSAEFRSTNISLPAMHSLSVGAGSTGHSRADSSGAGDGAGNGNGVKNLNVDGEQQEPASHV